MSLPLVIKCGDHQFAPYSFLCRHLVDGQRSDWNKVELGPDDKREVEGDWLCGDCYEDHLVNVDDPNNIVPICLHCVRELQARDGVSLVVELPED